MAELLVLVGFALLSVLSVAFGVDSRDESPDPHRSSYPVGVR